MTKLGRKFLLVYPQAEPVLFGLQYSLAMVKRKAYMPPLGLLTIAAMIPSQYEVRLVDQSCAPLTDDIIAWADVVLFSSLSNQKKSLFETAGRCRAAGKMVVFGGAHPTLEPEECRSHADVLVLDEGEITWPMFLRDFEAGQTRPEYRSSEKADITQTPCPRWDLVNVSEYHTIPIQYSRGCPFDCEFCAMSVLFGRRPRNKTPAQLLRELDAVLATGYRGSIYITDDNFIGNQKEVQILLPALSDWNERRGRPFSYGVDVTINLADNPHLLADMVKAGFVWVYIGVESASAESLRETHKLQNLGGSILDRLRTIQQAGLIIQAGFIVGFDHDTEDIFHQQIRLIQEAAVAIPDVNCLGAPPGTPLYERMKREGRLVAGQVLTNISTRLPQAVLLKGLRLMYKTLYEPQAYFTRVLAAFQRLPRPMSLRARWEHFQWLLRTQLPRSPDSDQGRGATPSAWEILIFVKNFLTMCPTAFRQHIRHFLWAILVSCPEQLPRTLDYILVGYHMYHHLEVCVFPPFDATLAELDCAETIGEHKAA